MILTLQIEIQLDETDGKCRDVSSSHFIGLNRKFPVRLISIFYYLVRSNLARLQSLESSVSLQEVPLSTKNFQENQIKIRTLCYIVSDHIAPQKIK